MTPSGLEGNNPAGEASGTEVPSPAGGHAVSTVTLVCAVPGCNDWPVEESRVLCQRHFDLVNHLIPERLEKRTGQGTLVCEHLSKEEIAAVSAQVERDALPFFLIAWNWCGIQALRKNLPWLAS